MEKMGLLNQFLETEIVLGLEEIGFSFEKEHTRFLRDVGDFKQRIHFDVNPFSTGGLQFNCRLYVAAERYKEWHVSQWDIEPSSIDLCWENGHQLIEWDHQLMQHNYYDLSQHSSKEIAGNLLNNLRKIGIPFLERMSDWEMSAAYIQSHYPYAIYKALDCYLINKNLKKANLAYDKGIALFGKKNNLHNTRARLEKRKVLLEVV